MSESCVLHPRLSNGEKSPLFTRLKNFLGDRKSAEEVYYRAINPDFKKVFPNVRFDYNGEPLFEDLITQCGIGYNKDNEEMLNQLNSEYSTSPVPKTIQSAVELQNRAASFNANNPLNKRYSAEVTSSDNKIFMEIVPATGNNRDLGRQQRFNAELNNQLIKLLNSWGADVAALTELEEASNINGVMDLSAGINAATGLKEVIRISKRHRWSNVSAKQNVLTDEEQEILNNAPRNSQGRLLAPNGKVSNLTERQYAQVRTKAFKRWFGDWENDPASASKVVDKNGEPLVVYHYTNNENLTKFSTDFDNYFSKTGGTKKAIFFTTDNVVPGTEDNFLTSRKSKLSLFLNIKNLETFYGTKDDLHKQGTSYREVVNKSSKREGSENGIVFTGFDDNRKENQTIYVVHSSNQIKSATDNSGLFNRQSNNIYDPEPNGYLVFTNALNKLASLYGIKFNDITDAELASDKWRNIISDPSSVNAFVYNG